MTLDTPPVSAATDAPTRRLREQPPGTPPRRPHGTASTDLAAMRPVSAVSTGVGLAGLAGLLAWVVIARTAPDIAAALGFDWGGRGRLSGPNSALLAVILCGVPMVLWSVLVDKVHRNPSTGIDWDAAPRPVRDVIDTSLVKLAGLWAVWGGIAAIYALMRFYWSGSYVFAIELMADLVPALLVGSIVYVLWLDRRMAEPRDGSWHFGLWVVGRGAEADGRAIGHFLRGWAVKGFFTAFMLSIVPANFATVVDQDWSIALASPPALAAACIAILYLIDVQLAMVGYTLTMRPLDAHIRTANPYALGWIAALLCYPPFQLMANDGLLAYNVGTRDWGYWFSDMPGLGYVWGGLLVGLTAVYAWATMAFGLRFSNLTHRGILTHGPYRLTRHPAYVSKNLSWWVAGLPFLVVDVSWFEGLRNCLFLLAVNAIYYWRAKTEEKHLLGDPAYVAYWRWAQAHAPVPRFWARVTGRSRPLIVLEPDPAVGPVA